MLAFYKKSRLAAFILVFSLSLGSHAYAQSGGSSTSVTGTVVDPSGAVVANAVVEIRNPVSGFERTVTTDSSGKFTFPNVPFNPYHLAVTAQGFAPYAQDVDVRSIVPVTVSITLQIKGSTETVTVEGAGADLLENTSTFHTDVDRGLFDKMPLESASSSLSSLVTLSSPGIAADSNGLFHGLGDHAENSFSVDGQPITDQQSKVFSNQIPLDSIESMEVISGAPPAEFGEKTSVVINVTTRSGQGMTTPKGSITTSYGSFGTADLGINLGYGGEKWGNFISASGLNSGRFLDPPEFAVFHDKGNEENLFDRVDFQVSKVDSIHVNLGFTRSWFQTPNAFDNLNTGVTDPVVGNPVAPTDQRSQIKTFNIAPSWTRLLSPNAVFTLGAFIRRDQYNYYPSNNPFSDFGPIQQETVNQSRTLANAGLRSDISYVKGIHNLKAGATYQQTFLDENTNFGVVDPALNAPCFDANGNAVPWVGSPGLNDPANCGSAVSTNGPLSRAVYLQRQFLQFTGLLRLEPSHSGGSRWLRRVRQRIVQFSRAYRRQATCPLCSGHDHQRKLVAQPGTARRFLQRADHSSRSGTSTGVAYNVKKTNTVLRVSYARVLETPFNENLVLASTGCDSLVLASLLGCATPGVATPFAPGWRNEFHAGLQQAFGKYVVFSGEYIWKYTHNAYDFSVLGSTPITFPIEWHNSKIPGFAGRVSVPDFHGVSALMVFSSVAARFFTPQIGGAGAVPSGTVGEAFTPFRIDHDERFNQTTHVQYQPWKTGPWLGFNWRYDSGLVAGEVPVSDATAVDLSGLTADQQFQAGLFCGSQHATPTKALPATCAAGQYGSTLISLPAPGKENDDTNPPRVAPRNLFDLAVGDDNLFHGERYKWSLTLTAINLTNRVALYNFLSTFSGTHYVTPRALTAQIGFHF